jgi:hypothetical protein
MWIFCLAGMDASDTDWLVIGLGRGQHGLAMRSPGSRNAT